MKRTVFIALMLICLCYILLGALLFKLMESSKEIEKKVAAKKKLIEEHRAFVNKHGCVTSEEVAEYVEEVLKTYDAGVRVNKVLRNITNATFNITDVTDDDVIENWDFTSALFFCVTVVTTIGYGNMSPKTWGGQLLCIFFAVIGIPLFAAWLMAVGERLQIPINKVKKLRPWIRNDPNKDAKVKSVVCIGSGILIIIFVPSIAFSVSQDWTYLASVYYAVISITTVGFGDLVPDFQENMYRHSLVKILLAFWILIGLSWCALILNEIGSFMQSQISTHARHTQEKLTHLESVMKKKAEVTQHKFQSLEHKMKEKAQETQDQAQRGYNFMEKQIKKKAQNTKDMIMRKSGSKDNDIEANLNGKYTPTTPTHDDNLEENADAEEPLRSESKESIASTIASMEIATDAVVSSDPPSPYTNHRPLSKQTSNSTTYTNYDN